MAATSDIPIRADPRMDEEAMSQPTPLPRNLPFRLAPKTIGSGAYASIKKAIPLDQPTPVFAVKFIHKEHATKHGRVTEKQLKMEVSLHSFVGQHPNVIEWFAAGEDPVWQWIAMEYAEGGDLFDKIEADVGVPEDIAQLYFMQLVAGVSFIHSKGVSHRDLKPENILMSEDGNLKIADFGLACMFAHQDRRKLSTTLCGSPPYIAPEILNCRRTAVKSTAAPEGEAGQAEQAAAAPPYKYDPELADIWSCGIILFVLLAGNTPWDKPSPSSWEFQEYRRSGGRSTDAIWAQIPPGALSLLRGMMNVEPASRFSFQRIRQHPWCTRPNPHLGSDGGVADPLHLATRMLENLRIDLGQREPEPPSPDRPMPQVDGAMDFDLGHGAARLSSTQPEAPISDSAWEFFPSANSNPGGHPGGARAPSATQPVVAPGGGHIGNLSHLLDSLSAEPSMSQFSQQRGIPLSLTQQARRFRDIVPAESLTRFYSPLPPLLLAQTLSAALHRLGVALPPVRAADLSAGDDVATLRVRTTDGRRQGLQGEVRLERHRFGGDEMELLGVRFVKMKGDPLEWRRFFKKVVLMCREAVYVPEG